MIANDFGLSALVLIVSYFVGSIPFGLILSYFAGSGDIRKVGSGNIGATNVLRTGNNVLAALTLILDGGKGAAISLFFMNFLNSEFGLMAGLMSVVGHNFPIWLKFQGGKGVATTLGVLLAVGWPIGVITCIIWLLVAIFFRYSSLAALVSLCLAPFFSWLFGYLTISLLATVLAILSIIRHHENLKNLLDGKERRIDFKK